MGGIRESLKKNPLVRRQIHILNLVSCPFWEGSSAISQRKETTQKFLEWLDSSSESQDLEYYCDPLVRMRFLWRSWGKDRFNPNLTMSKCVFNRVFLYFLNLEMETGTPSYYWNLHISSCGIKTRMVRRLKDNSLMCPLLTKIVDERKSHIHWQKGGRLHSWSIQKGWFLLQPHLT